MTVTVDPDRYGSGSHLNLVTHVTGPLAAGVIDESVAIDANGRAAITRIMHDPVLLLAPRASLSADVIRVRATLDPDGAATALPALEFAPYTEARSFLVLFRPPAGLVAALPVSLAASAISNTGVETAYLPAQLPALLELRVLEGALGRLLYLLGAEKQRIRREARILAVSRTLADAREHALDRHGADLGVPRFVDELYFDAAAGITTRTQREADDDYRRRLRLHRSFLTPTRRTVDHLLNGEGAVGNSGALGELGLGARFTIREADNPFAIAVLAVSGGPPSYMTNFLEHIRRVRLVWPQDTPAANAVVAARVLSADARAQHNALRARLRAGFTFPNDAALSPGLALSLGRLASCRRELGALTQWAILRAQDSGGGSRYQLGLGAELQAPSAAELDALVQRATSPVRPLANDPATESLLRSLSPQPAAADPVGRWLLEPCGLATVHRLSAGTLYVSALATSGVTIDGPTASPNVPGVLALSAKYNAPGDPAQDAVIVSAQAAAATQWAQAGRDPWVVLSDAEAKNRWHNAGLVNPGAPALTVFAGAGLPAVTQPAPVVEQLDRVPTELYQAIRLAGPLTQRILGGQPAAVTELRALVELLRAGGITSALPLITGPNEVILVFSVIGLPGGGLNVSDVRSSGFRWYVVPLKDASGSITPVGSQATLAVEKPGVLAVVVIGYARVADAVDPFQYRVELPAGAMLDLRQYEFLMNILERSFPLGVLVNTFGIRRGHIDLDGDGVTDPLAPKAARTYRTFRRDRHRGEISVTLPP
jgi:hypothetical protein